MRRPSSSGAHYSLCAVCWLELEQHSAHSPRDMQSAAGDVCLRKWVVGCTHASPGAAAAPRPSPMGSWSPPAPSRFWGARLLFIDARNTATQGRTRTPARQSRPQARATTGGGTVWAGTSVSAPCDVESDWQSPSSEGAAHSPTPSICTSSSDLTRREDSDSARTTHHAAGQTSPGLPDSVCANVRTRRQRRAHGGGGGGSARHSVPDWPPRAEQMESICGGGGGGGSAQRSAASSSSSLPACRSDGAGMRTGPGVVVTSSTKIVDGAMQRAISKRMRTWL
jgi:hypothetical protein